MFMDSRNTCIDKFECRVGLRNERLKFAVTTSLSAAPEQVAEAKQLAGKFKVPFVHRRGLSLETLSHSLNVEGILVVSSQKVSYVTREQEFFFHPGLACLRIIGLKNGKTDQMVKCMSLKKGFSVLDCTLGLGTDAIVASFVVGANGRVTGLESSIVIAELVRRGLATYTEIEEDIASAMRRVEVINTNYKEYLAGLPARSFDVIYFDPMFRNPRLHSPAMNAMRLLANDEPLDRETIDLAIRSAVKRVVMKERRGSAEFERLGFKKVCGGKYSPVLYGVIDLQRCDE